MSRLGAKILIRERLEGKKRKYKKGTKRSERKRKSTSQNCGQGSCQSSGFNWTRTPAPRLTVMGLILCAKYADCLRLLNFLMQKE